MSNLTTRIKNLVLRKTLFRVSEKTTLMSFQSEQELQMKCKKFSERNAMLEEILFELNKRNILTYVCCRGHSDNQGYIGFKVPKEEENFINRICTSLLRECPVSIYIHEGKTVFRGIAVVIYFSPQDRKEVLSFLLECIRSPKDISSDYMREAFTLCHIQEEIHDDMAYGFQIYPEDNGFRIEVGQKFMYFSLERRISLKQLSKVCTYIDTFSKEVKSKNWQESELAELLHQLNSDLLKAIEMPSIIPCDYYETVEEKEIKRMMEERKFYPGYLPDFINRNQARKLKSEEISYIDEFNTEEGLYLQLLQLEESLKVKRQKSLQEKKYML